MSPRVLVTDILFPSKYAKWRLVEIKSFIDRYDTDILIIKKTTEYLGVNFDIDYFELLESHSLSKYDILIFNSKFNWLNKYNDLEADGTKYNSCSPFDYMFRLKTYRRTDFDLSLYSVIYHIFLMCYDQLNKLVVIPHEHQFIHLYPGGGVLNVKSLSTINPAVNLISAQSFITKYIIESGMKNRYIEVFGGPFGDKDDKMVNKTRNNGTLNICFTSIGVGVEKGAGIYADVIQNYLSKNPNDNVKFYCIGRNNNIKDTIYLGLLPQKEIDEIYQGEMDILLNLDTGKALNGFPLGIEGLMKGVILFTPDYHNSNIKNGFNFGSEMRIINVANINDIITKLKELYDNRELLLIDSIKSQTKAHSLFGYSNTMTKVFNFIDDSKI